MSEEATPRDAVVPPTTEPLPSRPRGEEDEVENAAAKGVGKEGLEGEAAGGVATAEATAPAPAVDGMIACFVFAPSSSSLAN